MRFLFFIFLLAALSLYGDETGHKKYVSFEQEGKAIDGFLSRTYTLITYSWEQGGKYLARFRQSVGEEAEKKKQEVREEIRGAGSSFLRTGHSKIREAGKAAGRRILP